MAHDCDGRAEAPCNAVSKCRTHDEPIAEVVQAVAHDDDPDQRCYAPVARGRWLVAVGVVVTGPTLGVTGVVVMVMVVMGG